MRYGEWLAQMPESLKRNSVWKSEAYPKALLLFELAREDSAKLMRDAHGREIARELVRSAGSVSANIDEGCGRGVDRGEYVQFLRYALGSARETQNWYYQSRKLLPEQVVQHRMDLCSETVALLVTNIQRRRQARQKPP
jgi:four helix bundle protein